MSTDNLTIRVSLDLTDRGVKKSSCMPVHPRLATRRSKGFDVAYRRSNSLRARCKPR